MSGRYRRATPALVALAALLGAGAVAVANPSTAYAASAATIDGSSVSQPIDGFGISEFFGRSDIMHGSQGLSAQRQREIMDLLFHRATGAGLSILRLGIASGSGSIQPANPGGPSATPRYVWDGDDDGQVWLAKEAKAHGVNRFYANAWSAPGYMKTNNDEANGGTLCGLSGASCASGDWRRAYANYLVQYAKFYAQEGITVNDIGFTNEPNWTTSYSSAITADAEAHRQVDLHTGHSYGSYPTSPLPVTGRRTWMSEWSPDGTTWNENWDDGSGYDGLRVANEIRTALTGGNVNGYIYWYGASTGATRGFIEMNNDGYRVSKRLWAMAAYSRFIRPNANRIGASTSDGNLRLSAYQNTDGSLVVVALNTARSATAVSYGLPNTGVTSRTATPYLTNGSNSMTAQSAIAVAGRAFTATVPARSPVTYRITGQGVTTSRLRNEAAGRCADLSNSANADGSTTVGTRAQLWGCSGNTNQQWNLNSNGTIGSSAAVVTNRTTTGSGPMQDLSGKVMAGKTYTVTARVKYENPNSPSTKQFVVTMYFGGSTYMNLGSVTVPRGQWGLIQGTFALPAAQDLMVRISSRSTPGPSRPSLVRHLSL